MNSLSIDDYIKSEAAFYERLVSVIGPQILLYCVTGSLARKDIILGWSDIDVLIVIKDYTPTLMRQVGDVLSAAGNQIKIGVSIFSLEEFNHRYFKDSKTYISLSLIKQGYYEPRIIGSSIALQIQSDDMRKNMNIYDFARFGHDIKRELLRTQYEYDEKKVYKLTILLLKIALWEKGISASGYAETLQKVSETLEGLDKRLTTPDVILNSPEEKAARYNDYVYILEWFRKNTNAIFQ